MARRNGLVTQLKEEDLGCFILFTGYLTMLTVGEVIASYWGIISKQLIGMNKVTFALEQALKAQRGSRGIAVLFL
jgi:hypothetical protein